MNNNKKNSNNFYKRKIKKERWDPNTVTIGEGPFCYYNKDNVTPYRKDNYVCDECRTVHQIDCAESTVLNYQELIDKLQCIDPDPLLCNSCWNKSKAGADWRKFHASLSA